MIAIYKLKVAYFALQRYSKISRLPNIFYTFFSEKDYTKDRTIISDCAL